MSITTPDEAKYISVILSDDITRNISNILCEKFPESFFGAIYMRWLKFDENQRQKLIFTPSIDGFLLSSIEWDMIIEYLQLCMLIKRILINYNLNIDSIEEFIKYRDLNKVKLINLITNFINLYDKLIKYKDGMYNFILEFNLPNDKIMFPHIKYLIELYIYIHIKPLILLDNKYSKNSKIKHVFISNRIISYKELKYPHPDSYMDTIHIIFNNGNHQTINIFQQIYKYTKDYGYHINISFWYYCNYINLFNKTFITNQINIFNNNNNVNMVNFKKIMFHEQENNNLLSTIENIINQQNLFSTNFINNFELLNEILNKFEN